MLLEDGPAKSKAITDLNVCIHIVSTFTYPVRIIANLAHMCALKTDKMIRAERVAKENSLSQSREAVLQHGRSCSLARENSFFIRGEAHPSAATPKPSHHRRLT